MTTGRVCALLRIRPRLVESSVIFCFYVIILIRDAVIIND